MNMFNCINKIRLVRSNRCAALLAGAFLLCAAPVAHADDIQDANKLFKQGQHAQAMSKVDGYLAGKPKDAQARFLKGLILTEQGKSAEAIKIFTALTEDYPELPEPYNNLAVLYASQGQYDKAKQSLEMAIRTHPSYATAHENLGDIYAKMASQAYDRALQLDRSNTATQTKLAMIQDLFAGSARAKTTVASAPASPVNVAANKPAPTKAEPATKPEPVKPAANEPATKQAKSPAPDVKKADISAAAGNKKDVLKTINAWAAAWSSKNVPDYLAFYASDFRPQDGLGRSAWESLRKERISKPASIHVGISNASVTFADDTHATVQFHQSYHADKVKIPGSKTLLMVYSGGKWLIQEERAK